MTATEANVLEAAFDWANAQEALDCGLPAQARVKQALSNLLEAVSWHAAENDGETPIYGDPR